MDDADRLIDIEEQRARMQDTLRNCSCAIMIALNGKGELMVSYMNMDPVQRRGLIELLTDTKPRFWPVDEDDDED